MDRSSTVLSSFVMPGKRFREVRSRGVTTVAAMVLMTIGVSATAMLGQVVTAPTATASSQVDKAETDTGSTDLKIVYKDGAGFSETWWLYCHPTDGLHPDPTAACAALDANGETALPPVPLPGLCLQVDGGPQTAKVTGVWRGETVNARFSRGDSCEIFRWKALEGLLPKL
jgi:hypothetical protein